MNIFQKKVFFSDREKYINNRQQLESQLTENTLVKQVGRGGYLDGEQLMIFRNWI